MGLAALAGRWLFICILVVALPAKLVFIDLWRWASLALNQPDVVFGVPQLLALMAAEVSFVVALIGGSIFVGARVLRSGNVARVSVLYLVMAVLAYHLLRSLVFEASRDLKAFIASEVFVPDLEIWIAAAAWTYGAFVTWCSLSLRTKVQH